MNNQYEQSYIEQAPPKGSRYEVISAWGFIWYNIVLALPIIGFILMLVWSFSKNGPIQRRNYARAFLILAVLGIIVSVATSAFWWPQIQNLVTVNTTF